jgi:hypothetical protein
MLNKSLCNMYELACGCGHGHSSEAVAAARPAEVPKEIGWND